MRANHWRKSIAAAIVVIGLSVLLSGCTATLATAMVHVAESEKLAQENKDKPRAGDCWEATYESVVRYADWNTSRPVSCKDPHQLYTIAVKPLKNEHTGSLFKNGRLVSAVRDDAVQTCRQARDDQFGSFGATNARLQIKPYVPRAAQWKAGARWVRCDLNVLLAGSRVKAPVLTTLPSFASLKSEIKSHPTDFAYCVNVPGGPSTGKPTDDEAVFARCDLHPDWTLKEYINLDSLGRNTYPSKSELQTSFHQYCENQFGDSTHLTFARYPSKEDWAGEYFFMQCWVSAPVSSQL